MTSGSDASNAGETRPDLYAQIVDAFQGQLARFRDEEQSPDAEKRAKALAILAKTLETIAVIGTKLPGNPVASLGHQQGAFSDSNCGSEAGDTAELDRQLKELIDQLEESGEN